MILLPEAPLELKSHLGCRSVRDALDGLLELRAKVGRNLAQDRQGNRANAVIPGRLFGLPCLEVLVTDANAVVALPDLGHLRAVTDHVPRLAFKRPGDLIHATHRLEHGEGLIRPLTPESPPCFTSKELLEGAGLAGDTRAVTCSHVLVVAPAAATGVAILAAQGATGAECLKQAFTILTRELLVEGPLIGGLCEELGCVADKVGRCRHPDHGLAVVRIRAVNEGVAVVVDEHLEINTQTL